MPKLECTIYLPDDIVSFYVERWPQGEGVGMRWAWRWFLDLDMGTQKEALDDALRAPISVYRYTITISLKKKEWLQFHEAIKAHGVTPSVYMQTACIYYAKMGSEIR